MIVSPGCECCEPNASRCTLQAPLAGEIIAYLAEEGDPVEYRQELVEIAPYFGALAFALSLVPLARQHWKLGQFFLLRNECSVFDRVKERRPLLMACGLGITAKGGEYSAHLWKGLGSDKRASGRAWHMLPTATSLVRHGNHIGDSLASGALSLCLLTEGLPDHMFKCG